MSRILNLRAREILDSRGTPTVEVEVKTAIGIFRSSVPSGASTGIYEAVELRDKDPKRYFGCGVKKAVENVNSIIRPALLNWSVLDQRKMDEFLGKTLDGSKNKYGFTKGKLGANAILGVSMAVCRAGAAEKGLKLYEYIRELRTGEDKSLSYKMPIPCLNVINGGQHAGNMLAFQEFMIVPVGDLTFKERLRRGSEVYHELKGLIKEEQGPESTSVGDEGGFAPRVATAEEALELIMRAIEKSGYQGEIKIALDVAASEFYKDEGYNLNFKNVSGHRWIDEEEMIRYYKELCEKYPIISIEDPLHQDAYAGFAKIVEKLGKKVAIIGDDLLVTNLVRLESAIDRQLCTGLLLKMNQIGTVTESIDAFEMADKAGMMVMVSHRSGETEDCFIADLAVGLGAGWIKSGAPCRSERVAKYNQLLRIEECLSA